MNEWTHPVKMYLIRRDKLKRWKKHNPILQKDEPALETDTRVLRIGDGIHEFMELDCYGPVKKEEIEMDWKELDIGNLPSDILVGEYEFEIQDRVSVGNNIDSGFGWTGVGYGVLKILEYLYDGGFTYHYRKVEPKAPTERELHSESINNSTHNGTQLQALKGAVLFLLEESAETPEE